MPKAHEKAPAGITRAMVRQLLSDIIERQRAAGDTAELIPYYIVAQEALADSDRIDILEALAKEPGGILLHNEYNVGRRGLGLLWGRRTLRDAIDHYRRA